VLSAAGSPRSNRATTARRGVFEQLGVELLPAEPGALVFADDLIEKCRRQVATIFVARAAKKLGVRPSGR